jgi:hypothetical protein
MIAEPEPIFESTGLPFRTPVPARARWPTLIEPSVVHAAESA